MACEIAFLAGLHPHSVWREIPDELKAKVIHCTQFFIGLCLSNPDHSHWKVFKKKGMSCKTCYSDIAYIKDDKSQASKRGSYFCPKCQPFYGTP